MNIFKRFFKRKYYYLVAFQFQSGNGTCDIESKTKIDTREKIKKLEKEIENKNLKEGHETKKLCITNFIRLKS